MSAGPGKAPPDTGSTLRLILGSVAFVLGIALSVFGFLRLIVVLDGGGYGTSAMRTALVILGAAGSFLAAGIATLIWDFAKRHERD